MQVDIPAPSSQQCLPASTRYHGLDALRGIASVLVVLLHAGIPYMTNPLQFLIWPAKDRHPCAAVDCLTWCIECFVMPLFFVLAGFCSKGVLIARGERSFVSGRTRRLLATQAAAYLAILPLCLATWSLGWMADGIYFPKGIFDFRLPPELEPQVLGVAHLWFLQNLYIYCMILCGMSWVAKRYRGHGTDSTQFTPTGGMRWGICSVWKPVVLAIPCAVVLNYDAAIVLGFYQTFTPVFSKLIYYSIYFFAGAVIYTRRDELDRFARYGKSYLLVAGGLFVLTLPMIHEHTTIALSGLRLTIFSSLLALFASFATFGLLAIALKSPPGENSAMKYLAESSFWVYLIHLPLVGLAQVAIASLPIPAVGKFVAAASISLTLSLMTYHAFVRAKWIGKFLEGRGSVRNPEPVTPAPIIAHPATVFVSISERNTAA